MKGGGGAYQAKSGREPGWGERVGHWIKRLKGWRVAFGHGVASTRNINSLVPLEWRFSKSLMTVFLANNADFQAPP